MRRTRSGILVLVAMAACSKDSNTMTQTMGPATANDFIAALGEAQCDYQVKCGWIAAASLATCKMQADTDLKMYPPAYDVGAAVTAKKLSYSPAAGKACIAQWATAGCTLNQVADAYTACQNVYTGQVAVGGVCASNVECASGSFCNMAIMNPADGCTGACTAFVATGAACDGQTTVCGLSDECNVNSMICTPLGGVGASCGDTSCQPNLFCKGAVFDPNTGMLMTPGMCAGAGKVGDACGANVAVIYLPGQPNFFTGTPTPLLLQNGVDDCDSTLFCDPNAATPVCTARLAAGADCTSIGSCQDTLECLNIQTDMNGMVTTPGKCGAYLDAGKACDPSISANGSYDGCAVDTFCDPAKSVCTPFGHAGDDCSMATGPFGGGFCNPNFYCDDSGTCQPMVALNAACTAQMNMNEPCHDGACDGKMCTLTCM